VHADEPYGRIWGLEDLEFGVILVSSYLAPWRLEDQMRIAGLELDQAGGILGS
jgi:hypothetical protein